ncbi:TetR/AcrR family transcriptional regulator [Thermoactinospora rubra]|uniref:TetR/AcrR family transcriptional regulator n=1 Tax=Thermoactinospora rubra TaxID=1088767 RepID=UPI000A11E803|nr:TetR family transcriptional regulator [Thermoactinospora rubra]
MSLRERKKAKTRALIQREALRLFREQGYEATTVEQVAEAAEVATSTVFRYFPAKEDLVLLDHAPRFLEALESAPAELGPVAAVRHALRELAASRTPQELAEGLERERLMLTVPELWAASLKNVTSMIATIRDTLARRAGRDPADPWVRDITGAVVGVIFAVWLDWAKDPGMDGPAEIDRALAALEVLD